MIVSLKKSIPLVIKLSPDIAITGEWLKSEIDESLYYLQKAGFYVPAVIIDDHPSNVRAFKLLLNNYNGNKNLLIDHPVYNETLKTYLLFDIVHLVKNIRNNFLSRKKFVFPEFSFDEFRDLIEILNGFISWKIFYDVYEKDSKLQANLRKARKLMRQFIQFITSKVCYWPLQSLMNQLQMLQNITFRKNLMPLVFFQHFKNSTSSAKTHCNTSSMLTNAVVCNNSKPECLLSFATWIEPWSTCPNF